MPGVGPGQLYHFQADGPYDPEHGLAFRRPRPADRPLRQGPGRRVSAGDDGIVRPPKCVVVDDEFDWQGDRHLRRSLAETMIYEMHVRGFTCRHSRAA